MASPLAKITAAAAETVTKEAAEALLPNFRIGGKKVYLFVSPHPEPPSTHHSLTDNPFPDQTT